MRKRSILVAVLGAGMCLHPARGGAQLPGRATAGSEVERYLRALQVRGMVPAYPMSVRGFALDELPRLAPVDSAHPWAARFQQPRGVSLLPVSASLVHNSAFPYGRNDGALWAGRGVTASGSAGVAVMAGPLSLRAEPVAFWAQNADFELMPNRQTGRLIYGDPFSPSALDYPQRFGPDPVRRIDPGQSSLRLHAGGVAVAVSTANEVWGPAIDQPLVLSAEGPGFLHASLGTARPVNVGIGRVHGRILWGRLEQSAYAAQVPGPDRLGTGLVLVLTPAHLTGLEIGGTRFFHIASEDGFERSDYLRPLGQLFKRGDAADSRAENQVASVFARWVLPRAGVEFYGEYAREDHNYDLLDFLLEPDHTASYLLGAQRVWQRGRSLMALRAELVNSQESQLDLVRHQGTMYRHTQVRQGHTHRGQLLGSTAAYGGGGSVIALETFTPRGRWSIDWTRTRLRDNWQTVGADSAFTTDVLHTVGGEMGWVAGRLDLRLGLRAGMELNRHFQDDRFNLTSTAAVRVAF